MITVYPACFFKEENGYSVVFPDLNYLSTCGNSLEEAMLMAEECLAGYLYVGKQYGDSFPEPSKLENIDPAIVAKELGVEIGESFKNLISVDIELYAKMNFEKSVKKTLTIPAWLNKLAVENDINFSQALQEILKKKLNLG